MLLSPQERAEEASSIRTVIVSVTPVDARVSWSLCSEMVSFMFEWIKAKEFYSLVLRLRLVNWHWIERKERSSIAKQTFLRAHFSWKHLFQHCFRYFIGALDGFAGLWCQNFKLSMRVVWLCGYFSQGGEPPVAFQTLRSNFGQTLVKLWVSSL